MNLPAMVDMLSSVPLVLLAMWLVRLRPRRRGVLWLAGLSAAWAMIAIATNIGAALDLPAASPAWLGLTYAGAGAGVLIMVTTVGVLRWLPRPLEAADRPRVRLAALGGLAAAVGMAGGAALLPSARAELGATVPGDLLAMAAVVLSSVVVSGVLTGFLLFLGARSLDGRVPEAVFRQDALMAGAVVLMSGYNAGAWLLALGSDPPLGFTFLTGLVGVVALALAAFAWLVGASRREGRAAALGRGVALLHLAVPAAAMVGTVLVGGFANAGYGPYGIMRTLAVLVLAYAIVRHDLLGLDLKVRWTIQKSTVAAAFIGVFFVVSEAAQQMFQSSLGPAAGIVAAGALVFAMAPLQRAAERVASAAVPGAGPVPTVASRRDEVYRRALGVALRDKALTPEEQVALGDLAEELGIGAGRALALMHEVEQEQRLGGRS